MERQQQLYDYLLDRAAEDFNVNARDDNPDVARQVASLRESLLPRPFFGAGTLDSDVSGHILPIL